MDPFVLRHHWFAPEPSETVERFAVLARRGVVGLCTQRHDDWARMATRYGGVQVILHPDVRTDANLTWAFDRIEERSRQDGTEVLRTWGREDDVQLFDLLARRGYSVDRRLRYWELDLVANRRRLMEMAAASRTRMAAQGVRLLTLAQDQDPERFRQLHELDEEGDQDVPSTVPHLPKSFDVFMKWFDEPGLHPDRLLDRARGRPGRRTLRTLLPAHPRTRVDRMDDHLTRGPRPGNRASAQAGNRRPGHGPGDRPRSHGQRQRERAHPPSKRADGLSPDNRRGEPPQARLINGPRAAATAWPLSRAGRHCLRPRSGRRARRS